MTAFLRLVQVLPAGTAPLLTDNATFMMLKPSVLVGHPGP